jgi:hypothetical protein
MASCKEHFFSDLNKIFEFELQLEKAEKRVVQPQWNPG